MGENVSKEPLDDLIFLQLLKELLQKIEEYRYYLKDHPGYRFLKNTIQSTLQSLESFYRP